LNLPYEFISNIENTFQEDGHTFLKALPDSIAAASAHWGLTDVQPSPMLSYNFVAFAKRGDEPVVLKMGVSNREFKSEMAALRLFNGEGACRLIDYEEEKYWMLLERLNPGVMLATLEDDEEATYIAADVMRKIWRPMEHVTLSEAKSHHGTDGSPFGREERSPRVTYDKFIRLSDWFDGLKRLRARFHGGTGPLHEKLVERVEHSVKDFFTENHKPVLMHGDFHHFNILSSERGWLVIDPKGVIGPAGYEVGPLLLNPWDDLLKMPNHREMTKRRIDILHESLGFERERIREWGLAHAVLSAWWSIEERGEWRYAAAFAEMIADLS
jgi:streptomycin 6-kinase